MSIEICGVLGLVLFWFDVFGKWDIDDGVWLLYSVVEGFLG